MPLSNLAGNLTRRHDFPAQCSISALVRPLSPTVTPTAQASLSLPASMPEINANWPLAEIEADTRQRWPVGDMVLEHRLGHLEVDRLPGPDR